MATRGDQLADRLQRKAELGTGREELRLALRRHGDQQPATGLRIAKQRFVALVERGDALP